MVIWMLTQSGNAIDSILLQGLCILWLAIIIDLIIGDPHWLPHPVIGFGKLIAWYEVRWNHSNHRRLKGTLMTGSIGIIVLGLSLLAVAGAYSLHTGLGMLVEAALISTTIAIKGLKQAACSVLNPLLHGKLDESRKALSWIVGRDTESLEEPEIVRGTVETVAENTVDGITSPLFWAFIGGAPAALVYRAVNTMDSMVGYKNERYHQFGWASARLDDVLNYVPSRLTALAMLMGSLFNKAAHVSGSVRIVLRDAPKHPSPNSGWPESACAALLGIQLGGMNTYQGQVSQRARMGDHLRDMRAEDIRSSIKIMHAGWIVLLGIITIICLLICILR